MSDRVREFATGVGIEKLGGIGLILATAAALVWANSATESYRLGRDARRPTWPGLASLSVLAGLGFTMSLFIAQLAFVPGPELAQSKAAILCASTLAAMVGMAMTRLVAIRRR